MRPLYFIVWWCLSYSLRLFFRKVETVNSPKSFFGRTIYVSNHAASFMDPLVVASFRRPIVFFMTRSDVFTPISKPLLWSVHMLPIYRQLDGVNTKEKNLEVFKECSNILKRKRNLLIFGEGFTDDVFVRRLKPIKKGALRIGFSALESMNWSEKIYIAGVGCNYTEPNRMRSDLLISTSEHICLNDFKDAYEANPNKVITELTVQVEKLMKNQITHVENPNLVHLHESIMILTRKGMNAVSFDDDYSLKSRFKYSQSLADWINNSSFEALEPLKEVSEKYFNDLKKSQLTDDDVWRMSENKLSISQEILKVIVLLPFSILGVIHCGIPYLITKKYVEKSFKRPVFWGSTKMLFSMSLIGLLNIPLIIILSDFLEVSSWYGFLYYLLIGLFGLSAYNSMNFVRRVFKNIGLRKINNTEIIKKRNQLKFLLEKTLPVEFH